MEILSLIPAIVSVITLIVFFVLASNVSAIRKDLNQSNDKQLLLDYLKNYRLGKIEHARQNLQDMIYEDWLKNVSNVSSDQMRVTWLNKTKEKYKGYLEQVDLEWPEKLD